MIVGLLFTVAYFVRDRAGRRPPADAGAAGLLDLRPHLLAARTGLEVPSETFYKAFNGTPFKNVVWRLLGVRIGRRVFDDGCGLTERSFTTIGDHCTLNAGSTIQCHSQEDGAFKSDRTVLGAGCTLGVGAFVHYGVTMGDGATLAPDSFLMKGEEIAPRGRWGGNPATEIYDTIDDLGDALAVDADRMRPGRPEDIGRGRTPGKLPAAVAATALGALTALALTGGTAVAMGVPLPFGAAARTSAVPVAPTSAPAPPSSTPASAVELTATPAPTGKPAGSTGSAKRTAARPATPSRPKTTTPRAARTSTTTATTTPRATATTTPSTTRTSTTSTTTTPRASTTTPRTSSSASTGAQATTPSTTSGNDDN